MKTKLTPRQKELVELAKEKGFLNLEDFNAMFTSPISRKSNMERLVALKILETTTFIGKFKYIGEE